VISNLRTDEEEVGRLNGMYVGQLDSDELAAFDRERKAGRARASYNHAGGFLGLAKVEVLFPSSQEPR